MLLKCFLELEVLSLGKVSSIRWLDELDGRLVDVQVEEAVARGHHAKAGLPTAAVLHLDPQLVGRIEHPLVHRLEQTCPQHTALFLGMNPEAARWFYHRNAANSYLLWCRTSS